MRTEYFLLILGMAIVAYIPRALPAVFIEKLRFGKKVKKFLELIPYTAMTALIIPDIFTTPQTTWIGLAGVLLAAGLAWKRVPVTLCLISALALNVCLYAIF
jgi:branched-subunit amino acid transport protein